MEVITLGGGCFWCIEAAFSAVRGVSKVVSGYAGGDLADPSYEQVCMGKTGHAEVVQIHFDPNLLSLRDVLEIFFTIHDPTTPNRQGADVGSQYRSAVFYSEEKQRETIEEGISELEESSLWPAPFVTEVSALSAFYPAEEYHQRYFEKNKQAMYCQLVISPKLAALRSKFSEKLIQ